MLCHLTLISCSLFPQAQLRQADAQSVHQHYEEVLSGVRAKATYASRQLSMASMAANQSLRYIPFELALVGVCGVVVSKSVVGLLRQGSSLICPRLVLIICVV